MSVQDHGGRQSGDMTTNHRPRPLTRERSRGEIEAAVCEAVSRFQQNYMGRGPRHAIARLVEDTLFIRLDGVLSAAEQRLVDVKAADNGRGAEIVRQFRSHLISLARPLLEAVVHEITGASTLNLHHDLSLDSGAEVIVFTLATVPECRGRHHR